ncbi:MAG: 1-(5-phosphoribosyl)-5-[Bacteroidales bacterium]|nr:1-(5-phosphoribosyl)-5-[(5-phosphoribosylamino)methylideneamino]imidazole-4-carboxamide isomerase [Bacteroidales bacterium]
MIKVVPAIDIIGGRCVRLSQGDYNRSTFYSAEPSEMAVRFLGAGLSRIHAVDLEGAKSGHPVNLDSLRKLSSISGAEIEWGGGIKTREDVDAAFEAGASRVVMGTTAVKDPGLFKSLLLEYGSDRIVLGADVRGTKVAVSGWTETSAMDISTLLEPFFPDLLEVIVTDISKDGMFSGPDPVFYKDLMNRFPSLVITASGGVGSIDDIKSLGQAGVPAVIVGKALYEGRIRLEELGHGC